MKEYSELKRLAEAATKCYGAMRVEKDYNGVYQVVGAGSWNILSAWHTPDGKSKDNAEFHAAASPDAVLALIAELEILKYDCKVANSCVNAEKKESKRIIDENESLKKDAARYRWLRVNEFDIGSYHPEGDHNHESWFEHFDDQSIDQGIADEAEFAAEAMGNKE